MNYTHRNIRGHKCLVNDEAKVVRFADAPRGLIADFPSDKFKAICDGWLRTPFRHHCAVQNLGVDCVHFCYRIYEACGVNVPPIPEYPKDHWFHSENPRMVEYFDRVPHVEIHNSEESLDNLQQGDLLMMWMGKTEGHMAIYFKDRYFYHAHHDFGVAMDTVDAPKWINKLTRIIRPCPLQQQP